MIEHEKPDARGKIAMPAIGIDRGDKLRQGHIPRSGDILKALPESVLKTDTCLVTGDDNRAFNDRRFHQLLPF